MGTVHKLPPKPPKNKGQFEGPVPRMGLKSPRRPRRLPRGLMVALAWLLIVLVAAAVALLR